MYSKLEIKKDSIVVDTGDAQFHPATLMVNGLCYFRDLPLKLKKPVFTTDDGVDMFDGKMWLLSMTHGKIKDVDICANPFRGVTGDDYKYFSTKEAAEKYIHARMPIFSVEEIIVLFDEIYPDKDYDEVYLSLLKTRILKLSSSKFDKKRR